MEIDDSDAFFRIATRTHIPGRDNARRVEELLGRMTLEEKIGQMTQLEIGMVTTGKDQEIQIDPAKLETNDYYSARQVGWAICEIAKDLRIRGADELFARKQADPLMLNLPSGPDRSVVENLRRWLPAASRYEPGWFQGELKMINSRMAP